MGRTNGLCGPTRCPSGTRAATGRASVGTGRVDPGSQPRRTSHGFELGLRVVGSALRPAGRRAKGMAWHRWY